MGKVAFDEWSERQEIISIYLRGKGRWELDKNCVVVVRLWPWWD